MKRVLLFVSFIYMSCISLHGQNNLVKNGSFEIFKDIPLTLLSYDENAVFEDYVAYWEGVVERGTPDYYHRLAGNSLTGVPINFSNTCTYVGGNPIKQEPYDDDGQGIDYNTNVYVYTPNTAYSYGIDDAYIGFTNSRKSQFVNGIEEPDSWGTWAEYIQQELDSPLEVGKCYQVRYNVSIAPTSAYGTTCGRETYDDVYLQSFGVYFSNEDILTEGYNYNGQDFPYNTFQENEWDLIDYNDTEGFNQSVDFFDKHGCYNNTLGTHWINIVATYSPRNEDKNYITIGNFQAFWGGHLYDPNAAPGEEILPNTGTSFFKVYHLFDNVEVYEIDCNDDCICGLGTFEPNDYFRLIVKPKINDSGTDQCCYDICFYIEPAYSVCPVDAVKLYLDGNTTPTLISYCTENYYQPGHEHDIGEICFDEEDFGLHDLHATFHKDNDPSVVCESDLRENFQGCVCHCDLQKNSPPSFSVNIESLSGSNYCDEDYGLCCWEVVIENSSGYCDYNVDNISFDYTVSTEDLPSDYTFTGGNGWEAYGTDAFINNNVSKTIGYDDGPITIGTICFQRNFGDEGAEGVDFTLTVEGDSFDEDCEIEPLEFDLECESWSEPCTPDYVGVTWEYPEALIIDDYFCSSASVTCDVTIYYTYRHVEPEGNSTYRDIQILGHCIPDDCEECKDEIINQIIIDIWSDQDVITEFGLHSEDDWPNSSEKCFYNFRLITSDCFEQLSFLDPETGRALNFEKKCNSDICCYATYKVCYSKDDYGNISYSDSERLSQYYVPEQCNPPCAPNNCSSWSPEDPDEPGGGGMQKKSIIENNKNDNSCNVYINNTANDGCNINLECKLQGNVLFRMYDLLGNLVFEKSVNKNSHYLIIPIEKSLLSGIYLINASIDNKFFYNDKLVIIK